MQRAQCRSRRCMSMCAWTLLSFCTARDGVVQQHKRAEQDGTATHDA